ncbi:MAG: Nudix family hydrolase [Sedimenticola sp.]|nr:Nudix family hydrolase [Sedimenticola sp.]
MLPIHVAVGVIQDSEGRILLSRRPDHVHQGGLWEFPGGKVERREDLSQALRREIREELGIEVLTHQPLITVTHNYPDKQVKLDVHRIVKYAGRPMGMEGQPLEWVAIEQLSDYPMPAADQPICNALKLPDSYLITGDDPADEAAFLGRLEASLNQGVRLVQLRAPGLTSEAYGRLASVVYPLCQRYGATLLANVPVEQVEVVEADGYHLSSQQLLSLSERPIAEDKWLSASCHNPQELQHAGRVGADFVVLSPVLTTTSHPGAEPIGWERFSDLIQHANFPVYALGGMETSMIQQAQASGAQGIAAIRALWCER